MTEMMEYMAPDYVKEVLEHDFGNKPYDSEKAKEILEEFSASKVYEQQRLCKVYFLQTTKLKIEKHSGPYYDLGRRCQAIRNEWSRINNLTEEGYTVLKDGQPVSQKPFLKRELKIRHQMLEQSEKDLVIRRLMQKHIKKRIQCVSEDWRYSQRVEECNETISCIENMLKTM